MNLLRLTGVARTTVGKPHHGGTQTAGSGPLKEL